jgi:hypothetical protein
MPNYGHAFDVFNVVCIILEMCDNAITTCKLLVCLASILECDYTQDPLWNLALVLRTYVTFRNRSMNLMAASAVVYVFGLLRVSRVFSVFSMLHVFHECKHEIRLEIHSPYSTRI